MRHKQYCIFLGLFFLTGCLGGGPGNVGRLQIYKTPSMEVEWIRQGEPVEFEKESWYPQDGIENLLDSEVLFIGDYRGVQVFVEKIDVRPYDRLYTKFGPNQFRYYEKKASTE